MHGRLVDRGRRACEPAGRWVVDAAMQVQGRQYVRPGTRATRRPPGRPPVVVTGRHACHASSTVVNEAAQIKEGANECVTRYTDHGNDDDVGRMQSSRHIKQAATQGTCVRARMHACLLGTVKGVPAITNLARPRPNGQQRAVGGCLLRRGLVAGPAAAAAELAAGASNRRHY